MAGDVGGMKMTRKLHVQTLGASFRMLLLDLLDLTNNTPYGTSRGHKVCIYILCTYANVLQATSNETGCVKTSHVMSRLQPSLPYTLFLFMSCMWAMYSP